MEPGTERQEKAVALFKICVLGLFTLLVVRAIGLRGTMSERTYGLSFLFGALYGLILVPVLARFTSPYGELGPWVAFFTALFLHVAYFLPVYFAFFKSRAFQGSSIADVFLVAFLVGFGADFGPQLLSSLTAVEPIAGFASFPPFTIRVGEGDVPMFAGHGYWNALVALAVAGCLRFVRRTPVVWAVGILVLAFTAFEAAAYFVPPTGIWETLYKLTRTGSLTPWLVVLGTIGLCVWEGKWSVRAKEPGKFPLLEEWQALLGELFRGRFRAYAAAASRFRTTRRAEIIASEAAASPGDAKLQAGAEKLAKLAGSVTEVGVPDYGQAATKPAKWWAVWGGWIGLAVALFLLPKLPEGFRNWVWTFWGLHFSLARLPFTILTLVLTVILVRRLFGSAGRPAGRSRPDDIVAFVVERSVLMTALAMAITALVYGSPERLFDPAPYVVAVQNYVPYAVASTMLLLFAVAATGVTLSRSQKWTAAPIEDRRRYALRTSLDVLAVSVLAILVNMMYLDELQRIHTRFGPALFRKYQGDGNYVAALGLAVAIGLVSVGLLYVMRKASRRAEHFLVGDPRG